MWAVAGWAACAAIALYVVLFYPLWLRFGSFPLSAPIGKRASYRTTVTVVMAVYNGATFLRAKLDSLLGLDYDHSLVQILVVSDGSTDDTEAIAWEYADRGVELLVQPHSGKASAVNVALQHATGEILFFTDVRQPLEPSALAELVANFADPSIGAVTGELRLLAGEAGEQQDMGLYWKYEIWARSQQSSIYSLFNTTGCIYALRRSLARPLPADTLSDDAALPLGASAYGRCIGDCLNCSPPPTACAGTSCRTSSDG
jgi:cellulose synthase/poly-beta-1,6-N-acetylglucosamine synthase-like glycosyltransferase